MPPAPGAAKARLLFGIGMRLTEGLRLRIKNIGFQKRRYLLTRKVALFDDITCSIKRSNA